MRIERQRSKRRRMGTGDPQLTAEQMADHRLSPRQRIDAAAGAVGRQGSTAVIVGEPRHHRDGRGTGSPELPTRLQQGLGLTQAPPARAAGTGAEADLQGPVGDHHRADVEAQSGPAAVGHLQVALAQLTLDARIEQQPHPLLAHGSQQQLAGRKAVEAGALDVVDAWVTPIQRCTVHHVGMGDQAAAGRSQQPGHGQCIARISPLLTTDPGGDHQQDWQGRRRHTSTTASTRRPWESTAVIAQRSGRPRASRTAMIWASSGPGRRWSRN